MLSLQVALIRLHVAYTFLCNSTNCISIALIFMLLSTILQRLNSLKDSLCIDNVVVYLQIKALQKGFLSCLYNDLNSMKNVFVNKSMHESNSFKTFCLPLRSTTSNL